jgi:hypothetical protein
MNRRSLRYQGCGTVDGRYIKPLRRPHYFWLVSIASIGFVDISAKGPTKATYTIASLVAASEGSYGRQCDTPSDIDRDGAAHIEVSMNETLTVGRTISMEFCNLKISGSRVHAIQL